MASLAKMAEVPEYWQRKVRTVFNVLDCDGRGVIDKDTMSVRGQKWGDFYKDADPSVTTFVVASLKKWLKVLSPDNAPLSWQEFVLRFWTMWNDRNPELVDAMDSVMRRIYEFIDTNGSGFVCLGEFQNWWHANGWDNVNVCHKFFPMMDREEKGWVTKKQFCAAGYSYFDVVDQMDGTFWNFWWGPLWTEFEMPDFWVRKARTVFETIDVKKSGTLNLDSMEAIANHWCQLYGVSEENRGYFSDNMKEWWTLLNPDNTTMDWAAFVRSLWKMWGKSTPSPDFISANEAIWGAIFHFIADLSGYVSWKEFQYWWRVNGWNNMIECEKVFKWMDSDNKGLVSRRMFCDAARWYFEITDELEGMERNLWWGPLYKEVDMPDYWVRKMKAVFRCFDVDKTGVLTKSSMPTVATLWSSLKDEQSNEKVVSSLDKWMTLLNPEDRPMTCQDFIRVMWVKVNNWDKSFWNAFGLVWEKMFEQMDPDNSRKMSRVEFISWCQLNGWFWEENMVATVNFLEDHGWLTKQQFCDACRWYFNVFEKAEEDEWNLMFGPLEDKVKIPFYWSWKVTAVFNVLDINETGILNRESMKAIVESWCAKYEITDNRVGDYVRTFERWMTAINSANDSLTSDGFVKAVWDFIQDRENLTLAQVKDTFAPIFRCLFDLMDDNDSGKITVREYVTFWRHNDWKGADLCKSTWKCLDADDQGWLDRKEWQYNAWLYFEVLDQVIGTDQNLFWGPLTNQLFK
ncbi:unnamed protein product [Owenia fusiformis]|uniref:Uncharacterized protein n=1 Tax=Owenia fusiformis TaxID=6347 RepID=A0A8J1Y7T5_OWEFU|nr:unnamed protein product [Owenia fusiformis]